MTKKAKASKNAATARKKPGSAKPTTAKAAAAGSKKGKTATQRANTGSKTDKVIGLLRRSGGVTIGELIKATGWQAHSVRGFLSGTIGKKMGLKIISTKSENGARTYSVSA